MDTCPFCTLDPRLVIMSGAGGLTVWGNGPVASFIGGSSELTCSFTPTNPPINPGSWNSHGGFRIGSCRGTRCTSTSSKYRLSVSTTGSTGMMTLNIDDTQVSDFGSYLCRVSTTEDTKSVSLDLKFRECPMRIPSITCSSSVTIGSNSLLTMQCFDQLQENQSYHHQTQYEVVHFSDSSSLHPTKRTENFSLLTDTVSLNRDGIPNATEDSGLQIITQCCRNETKLPCKPTGEDFCSGLCNTTVLYPPSDLALKQSPPGPWQEGSQNSSILCLSNGFPSPTVSWRRVHWDGSPGVVLANGTDSSTLFFPEVQRHQTGAHRCEADNHLGRVDKMMHISIEYPPYIDHRVSIVHGNEGTVISLPCIVDANPSTSLMITWFTPNQSRIATDKTFFIKLTSPSDDKPERRESRISFTVHRALFGNYTCTARNTIGSDSFVIQLSGHCYPDPPYNLTVVSYSETSLTLSWTPGQDGGLPVTFTVSCCVNKSQMERTCKTEQSIVTPDITVTELKSYTLYSITLLAVNGVGSSKTNVEIVASTAPEALDIYGIKGWYQIESATLEISPAKLRPLPLDLCIYAEFHVGGFRHRNETCLRPGQSGYIKNGAKENQLFLVVCGRGVCSSRSAVTYTDDEIDIWRLMVIVIPVICCFIGFVLLLLVISFIRWFKRRRPMAYDLKTVEPSTRILPTPPTQPLGVRNLRSDHTGQEFGAICETYEVMETKRVDKGPVGLYLLPSTVTPSGDALSSACGHSQRPPSVDGALPPDDQGYIPMDITHSEGIYMTHIRHGHNREGEGEAGIACERRETELETCPAAIDNKPDEMNDDDDDDSVYDTYTVSEDEIIRHEYMEPIGQALRIIETAL